MVAGQARAKVQSKLQGGLQPVGVLSGGAVLQLWYDPPPLLMYGSRILLWLGMLRWLWK